MLPRFKSNETDPNGTSCLVEFQTVFFFSGIRDIRNAIGGPIGNGSFFAVLPAAANQNS
jgi:hypothetical protein